MLTTYTVPAPAGIAPEDLALARLTADQTSPLSISPVIHPQSGVPNPASSTFWSAVANAHYIVRRQGTDLFGQTPDLTDKLAQGNDLVDCGRRGPIGCDHETVLGMALWDAADQAALVDRPSAPVAYHLIGWLPTNATREAWRERTLEFLDYNIVQGGMIADWAIHALADPRRALDQEAAPPCRRHQPVLAGRPTYRRTQRRMALQHQATPETGRRLGSDRQMKSRRSGSGRPAPLRRPRSERYEVG